MKSNWTLGPTSTSEARQQTAMLTRPVNMPRRVTRLCLLAFLLTAIACSGSSPDRGSEPGASATATAAVSAAETAEALAAWAGSYEYVDSAGQTAGGTGVVTTYRLEVPTGMPSKCTLSVAGFQSDRTLVCEVSATPTEMSVRFLNYESGRVENEFGVAQYKPSDVLFTIQRFADGGPLVTSWRALMPDSANAEGGRYFVKADATSR